MAVHAFGPPRVMTDMDQVDRETEGAALAAWRRVNRCERGNVAMMFALFAFPLVIAAGLAIDQMQTQGRRADLTEAVDGALLAASRAKALNATVSDADAEKLARRFFDANYRPTADTPVDSFKFSSTKAGADTVFELTVNGRVKTSFLDIIGQSFAPIGVTSQAKVAPPRNLEVALVLDNTDSMSVNGKIATLKTAAEDLVDQIMLDANNQTKVSVVPFGQYVNVGLAKRNKPWLDVANDSTQSSTNQECRNTYPNKKQTGTQKKQQTVNTNCRMVSATCTLDGASYSCQKNQCDQKTETVDEPVFDLGDPVQVCESKTTTTTNKWNGCVGSRNYPLNIRDENYTGVNRVPGLQNVSCTQAMIGLTTSKSDVVGAVRSMSTTGETYIPAGLTWGLRALSSDAPFEGGETFTKIAAQDGVKALVLMTDGANTKSPTYPRHANSDVVLANTLSSELCVEIAGKDIDIYTIAFDVTDQTIKNLLKGCATDEANYYDAKNAKALSDAFDAIASSLQELALTK
ncbi:MAG: TadE/TadG family type IV pilus assembly protein [Pseudomonadota bacterium]